MTMVYGNRPSNGTEGDYQRAQTCNRCTVDHDGGWHDEVTEGDDSCPIILSALVGEHSYPNPEGPPEWGHDLETGEWVCTAFKGPCACADAAPSQWAWGPAVTLIGIHPPEEEPS